MTYIINNVSTTRSGGETPNAQNILAEVVKTSEKEFPMQKGTSERLSKKTRWETNSRRVTNKASRTTFSRRL